MSWINAAPTRVLIGVFFAGAIVGAGTAVRAEPAPESFADLAAEKLPAVVNVSTKQKVEGSEESGPPGLPPFPPGSPMEEFFKEFFGQLPTQPRELTALGSGFIISSEGYVVTNSHVVENASEIAVVLHDDTELAAEVVGRDEVTDLALLKIQPDRPLPFLNWGDSERMRVGDWVVAIGNPFGLGGSVTAGIISARARDIQASPYDDFLQTDASINRGNSGGPLFAMQGGVVGVNTAIFSPTGGNIGIGFAIPASVASDVIEQLRKNGKVQRGWLGVQLQPITPAIAEAMGLDERKGALVAEVVPESPAAAAGIETGDVILSLDGQPVADGRDLARRVGRSKPGMAVELALVHDGKKATRKVTLGELPRQEMAEASEEPEPPTAESPQLGLTLAPVTPRTQERFQVPEGTKGAVVTSVEPGTPAERGGLAPGDVIVRAGSTPVENPQDVRSAVDEAQKSRRPAVLMLVQREDTRLFVALPLAG